LLFRVVLDVEAFDKNFVACENFANFGNFFRADLQVITLLKDEFVKPDDAKIVIDVFQKTESTRNKLFCLIDKTVAKFDNFLPLTYLVLRFFVVRVNVKEAVRRNTSNLLF
jgi:hypothetical protein